jgi:hypothetical protein
MRDTAVRERVAAARQEIELLIRGLGLRLRLKMRVEASAMPSQLAEAAGRDSDRAPILVRARRQLGSTRARSGAIAYRVLSMATVPVLMHVAATNAWDVDGAGDRGDEGAVCVDTTARYSTKELRRMLAG